MERVLNERIRILNAKLDKALEQRERFADLYHGLVRIPYQERNEIMRDCDSEIRSAGEPENAGQCD